MRHSILAPVLAIAVVVCVACFESSIPAMFYWPMIVASFGIILAWKLAMRSTIFQIESLSIRVDPKTMAALKPIGIAYLAFVPLTLLALWVMWYLDLGLSIFLLCVGVWSIRKEVYALMLSRRLASKSTAGAR